MTREIAHQKMFEAALDAIMQNFPPGKLPGDKTIAHAYFEDSKANGHGRHESEGFELVKNSRWGFQLHKSEQIVGDRQSADRTPSGESKTKDSSPVKKSNQDG